ncbi:hypothetical protein Pres01_02990 [Metapseudomonas resinovorans]|uniref:DUF2796 domain-containing protein n=1 Tax=Metapseudomonas resinovorans TaxID=53412 RepID=UPI00098581CC|nr:DUF2796 domain-containing protein [Pseudomonas resinovorans]GLZ84248.1 hypothetical protein Pres01_02990 [Pseudomonas resinovorans]
MRRLLLALPFALLTPAVAQAHEHDHDHEQGSLGAHEHGVAQLNAVLDGKTLELELESPAMNLVGFEHDARSDADKAKVAAVRAELEKPLALFDLPGTAGCKVTSQELASPLFGTDEQHDEHAKGHDHDHSEIHAHYQFECANPSALKTLDLAGLFQRFPATLKIQVQLIGPNGQQGAELSASNASLSF